MIEGIDDGPFLDNQIFKLMFFSFQSAVQPNWSTTDDYDVEDFHTTNIAIETLRSAPTKNILAESVNSENIAIQYHKPLNYLINFKISGMVIFL